MGALATTTVNMITVILLNENNFPRTPTLEKFQTWIDCVTSSIPEKIPNDCNEICISIVDKKTSAELNKAYRSKKGPTNILSFTYEPLPGIIQQSLGDCVICADIVEEEAMLQNKVLESHWAHLTIHGMLHLLGYDHTNDHDAEIMEALEIKILIQLKIENPYEQ